MLHHNINNEDRKNSSDRITWPVATAHAAWAAQPPAASSAATRLEPESNNVTSHHQHAHALCRCSHTVDDRLILRECRCRARTCPRCGKHYGHEVRRNLMAKSWMFRRPALLSLTVDRDGTTTGRGFASAQHAHKHVTQERAIARLLRLLGITRWVWVLEFQQKSGDGWPHWHVLIDLHGVDRQGLRVRVQRAWRLWRDRWGIGGLDLQLRQRFQQVEHAVRYVTKYLTKYPERGFPAWVIESSRIRFCAASREIGAIVSPPRDVDDDDARASNMDDDDDRTKQPKPRAEARPLVDRMAECGERTLIFAVGTDAEGSERLRYVDQVEARVTEVVFITRFAGRASMLDSEPEHLQGISADGTHYTIERTRSTVARRDLESLTRMVKACDELAVMRAERLQRFRDEILTMRDRSVA